MKCRAERKAGGRCTRAALRGTQKCFLHTAGRAAQAGQRGGLRRRIFDPSNLVALDVPKSAEDLALWIATTMNECRLARLDPRVANSLGQLGQVFLRALETGDLERRVAALESKRISAGGKYGVETANRTA